MCWIRRIRHSEKPRNRTEKLPASLPTTGGAYLTVTKRKVLSNLRIGGEATRWGECLFNSDSTPAFLIRILAYILEHLAAGDPRGTGLLVDAPVQRPRFGVSAGIVDGRVVVEGLETGA
jgi:hypothetical protein